MASLGEQSFIDNLELYEYHDFPAGQAGIHIRLLRLLPKADTDGMIRCTLSEHILLDDSCPPFEALSYVWGPPKDHKLILCDGQAILVTPNLYSALVSLRQSTPRWLWIDQICIQQDKALEKNAQIPLMRDIYSRAFRTIAWLGPENENMHLAFKALLKMSQAWNYYLAQVLERSLAEDSDGNQSLNQSLEDQWGIEAPSRAEFNAIKLLLYNTWFTRMWIIQEATVSKDVVMCSGSLTIAFDEVLAGIMTMGEFLSRTRQNDLTVEGNKMLGILLTVRNEYHKSGPTAIVPLIADCHLFKATDDRDRFFALYGVSTIASEVPHVQADYTLPAPQALTYTVVELMRYEKSLRFLELSDSSTQSDLPSWVPHARTTSDPERLPRSTLYNNDEWAISAFTASIRRLYGHGIEEKCPEFDWSAFEQGATSDAGLLNMSRSPHHSLPQTSTCNDIELDSGLILGVRGQLVDRVGETSPIVLLPAGIENGSGAMPQDTRFLEDIENADIDGDDFSWRRLPGYIANTATVAGKFAAKTMKHWQVYIDAMTKIDVMVMNNHKNSRYRSKDELLHAYRTVLTAGRTEDDPMAKSNNMTEKDLIASFDDWRKNISVSVQIEAAKRKLGWKGSAGMLSMLSTSVRSHASYSEKQRVMLSQFMSPLYGRRMGWTVSGRLALIPAQTRADDHILYLQGSEMPFVMRFEGQTWKLIGPTYVDGLMNGELYDADSLAKIRIR